MKDKSKGILHLLIVVASVVVLTLIGSLGIGSKKVGSMSDIKLGLDLAGGVSITYQTVKENPSNEEMSDTVYKLQKRVENYSTEAAVYQEGSNRVNVDIPGVSDAEKVLKELGNAGSVQFKTEDGTIVIDGSDVETAEAGAYQNEMGVSENLVMLTLNEAGAKKFAKATKENIGKKISIYYDGELVSDPVVQTEIPNGKAQIQQPTFEEAKTLATTIRIGALPLELEELRSNVVGAKLGEEAINTSLIAGIIGFAIVVLFMIVFYHIPGLAAGLALSVYVGLMILLLNVFNVTLTLPGIAGIILSIGMAVDANVIIFTRIREELATGKTVRSAIKIGFDKALSAIVDGNVTTLIASGVLYFIGSGVVKGFAQTLALGIILSMFTALFVTRYTLQALYGIGFDSEKFYGVQKEVKVINFVKHTKKFFAISGLLFVIGIVAMIINKNQIGDILNYGLDFRGGTSTEITFPDDVTVTGTEIDSLVRDTIRDGAEISKIQGSNAFIIRTRELNLDERTAISKAFEKKYNVDKSLIQTESISGTVSSEMKKDAILAVAVATICMLIYIWIRFKDIKFGTSAVLALVHDVLFVLMVYAVGKITVGNTFIACMLTIVGYSINATIVIFDRVRENLAHRLKKQSIEEVVNLSISQTISRSINTSLTTFIMVFALFLLGVDSMKEFAGPIMAGIVCGAYSSICITATLWYTFKKKFSKEV